MPPPYPNPDLRMCLLTGSVAIVAGGASAFFGIGGELLIVPGLISATGMKTIAAVGSSLRAVGTFGLATALDYAASGMIDLDGRGPVHRWRNSKRRIGYDARNAAVGIKGYAQPHLRRADFQMATYVLYRNVGISGLGKALFLQLILVIIAGFRTNGDQ